MICRNKINNVFPNLLKVKNGKELKFWYDPKFKFDKKKFVETLFYSHQPDELKLDVIKFIKRRSIFSTDVNRKKIIIKSFPLIRINDKLRYKKYAIAELLNNKKASGLGVDTPVVIGYFEIRKNGFVDNCGVVMEFLVGFSPLIHLVRKCNNIIFITIPLVVQLYEEGINHIDVSLNNIFFNEDQNIKAIIDWQYCSFIKPKNKLQLIVHAAYLLKHARIWPENKLWHLWLKQLHSKSGTEITYDSFSRNVLNLQKKRMTIKDRLRLHPRLLGIHLE